jgi:predicted kinase
MSQPWLILVTGPPCSGKSTLAARLSRDTGWPIVAKDDYKEILFDVLGTGNAAWSRRLSVVAFEMQLGVAEAVLGAGLGLILDGNFTAARHSQRISAMVAGRARALQVACRAGADVLAERQRLRARAATRHAGHLDARSALAAIDPARYAPLPSLVTLVYDSEAGDAEYERLLEELGSMGTMPAGN